LTIQEIAHKFSNNDIAGILMPFCLSTFNLLIVCASIKSTRLAVINELYFPYKEGRKAARKIALIMCVDVAEAIAEGNEIALLKALERARCPRWWEDRKNSSCSDSINAALLNAANDEYVHLLEHLLAHFSMNPHALGNALECACFSDAEEATRVLCSAGARTLPESIIRAFRERRFETFSTLLNLPGGFQALEEIEASCGIKIY